MPRVSPETIKDLNLSEINTSGDTQMRESLSEYVINQYAEHIIDGDVFPPVVVFYDGSEYWLADGFHRFEAHKAAKKENISADVKDGSLIDAIKWALQANATNGKPRTGGDMRRAYKMAVKNDLCKPYEVSAVKELILCSSQWARTLTKDAREMAKNERDALIKKLADEGKSQRDIAGEVGTSQKTVDRTLCESKRNTFVLTQNDDQSEPDEPETESDEDDEQEEAYPAPTYNAENPAYCKYCYTAHYDWELGGDFDANVWVCGKCEHATHDDFMQERDASELERENEELEAFLNDDSPLDENQEPEPTPEPESEPESEPEKKYNHRAIGTGENEWYTPAQYIEMVKEVFGGAIETDPASSWKAQEVVNANQYFDLEADGLSKEWHGKVWLNPPYAQPAIRLFIEKAVSEFSAGRASEMIVLTHNYTDTAWFHTAASVCSAICFTRGRIGFIDPEGNKAAPTQGQSFFYYGNNVKFFTLIFKKIGIVLVKK